MTSRPRLKSSLRMHPAPGGEGVFLLSEKGSVLLRGPDLARLLPLLDGENTEQEIVARMAPGSLPAEVFYRLEQLRRSELLARDTPTDGRCTWTQEEYAWWDLCGVVPRNIPPGFALEIVSIGRIDTGSIVRAIENAGISRSDGAAHLLVVTDDYLRPELGEVNRQMLDRDRPWMLCRPVGAKALIGPVFLPGTTACWECMAAKMRHWRPVEHYLTQLGFAGDEVYPIAAGVAASLGAAASVVALEVFRWIAGGDSISIAGAILAFDSSDLSTERHVVVCRPQCPACGDPRLVAKRQRSPLQLRSRPVLNRDDGGHRITDPHSMLDRFSKHISPLTGVISALRRGRVAGTVDGVVSFSAQHGFLHASSDQYFARETFRRYSGGKGMGEAQAKASAVGESLERYSGAFQRDEERINARVDQLAGAAIDPATLLLYSESQYATRDRWNAFGLRAAQVPERFEPSMSIDWTPVWSLAGNGRKFLPTACAFFGYAAQQGARFADADSNGCAAGSSLEEALLQGMLELVERDAVAIWWYNRCRRPRFDLDTFKEPYLDTLQDTYRSLGRELFVLDLTTDLGITVCAAVSRRVGHATEDIVLGFGAHLDPRIALLRSVTEMNQSLPAVHPAGQPDGTYLYSDHAAIDWWRTATFECNRYLLPDGSRPATTRASLIDRSSGDLRDDITRCVEAAARVGIDFYALDQTRPDIGLDVVRVVAPGLRHFWPRYAPGRLYDLPVKLGWVPAALREEDLNPRFIYF